LRHRRYLGIGWRNDPRKGLELGGWFRCIARWPSIGLRLRLDGRLRLRLDVQLNLRLIRRLGLVGCRLDGLFAHRLVVVSLPHAVADAQLRIERFAAVFEKLHGHATEVCRLTAQLARAKKCRLPMRRVEAQFLSSRLISAYRYDFYEPAHIIQTATTSCRDP